MTIEAYIEKEEQGFFYENLQNALSRVYYSDFDDLLDISCSNTFELYLPSEEISEISNFKISAISGEFEITFDLFTFIIYDDISKVFIVSLDSAIALIFAYKNIFSIDIEKLWDENYIDLKSYGLKFTTDFPLSGETKFLLQYLIEPENPSSAYKKVISELLDNINRPKNTFKKEVILPLDDHKKESLDHIFELNISIKAENEEEETFAIHYYILSVIKFDLHYKIDLLPIKQNELKEFGPLKFSININSDQLYEFCEYVSTGKELTQ